MQVLRGYRALEAKRVSPGTYNSTEDGPEKAPVLCGCVDDGSTCKYLEQDVLRTAASSDLRLKCSRIQEENF